MITSYAIPLSLTPRNFRSMSQRGSLTNAAGVGLTFMNFSIAFQYIFKAIMRYSEMVPATVSTTTLRTAQSARMSGNTRDRQAGAIERLRDIFHVGLDRSSIYSLSCRLIHFEISVITQAFF